jgi:hypothetical protein
MNYTVRAFIHSYDDRGRRIGRAQATRARLCVNEKPRQVLTIRIPDKTTTKFRDVYITRKELERVLGIGNGKQ